MASEGGLSDLRSNGEIISEEDAEDLLNFEDEELVEIPDKILDADVIEALTKPGFIYCLSNKDIPGLLKVGITTNIEQRLARLYGSGVPSPFSVEVAKFVNNPREIESIFFKVYAKDRHNPRREFFRLDVGSVKAFFEVLQGEYYAQPRLSARVLDIFNGENGRQTTNLFSPDKMSVASTAVSVSGIWKLNGYQIRHS